VKENRLALFFPITNLEILAEEHTSTQKLLTVASKVSFSLFFVQIRLGLSEKLGGTLFVLYCIIV
jgi:hypothetical protein